MITTFYPPYHFGGDATYVRALSRELVKRGHEVEVVHCTDAFNALDRSAQTIQSIEDDGIIVHRLASRFGILSPLLTQQTGHPGLKYRALKNILSQHFDVVNFHNISLIGGPSILKLSKAAVTLYTLHEHWLLCPTHIFWKNKTHACDRRQCLSCSLRSGVPPQWWRYTGLIKRSLGGVDSLLAPSQYTAQKHEEAGLGVNIHLLPLFSSLDPGEPAEFCPSPRPRFVYAGRITASKGILPMLNTFAKLHDVDLQVIGEGDLSADIRRSYAHCENISFTGHVSQKEMVNLYQNASALILPSLAPETFGLTVVEAFACGTPAIVRDAGGSRDLVDTTGAGLVYATDGELELMVKRIATDTGLRADLGKKAREGFCRWYTADRHVQGYLSHIADIQQKKAASGNAQ